MFRINRDFWELSGRALDSRPKGRGFEPHWRHWVVSLSKNINPSLVLVQPRKTRPFITERWLSGRKESNQTNNRDFSINHSQIMHMSRGMGFQQCNMCNQQNLRSACAYAQSDQSLC